MRDETRENYIVERFSETGIPADAKTASEFLAYYELLTEWNQVMNLTAVTAFEEVVTRHFLDSGILWKALSEQGIVVSRSEGAPIRLIDVGSGAGFPGLPLKLLQKDAEVTLLDALEKRVRFLDAVISRLMLSGVVTVHGRSEDFGNAKSSAREAFDLAVSRAVSALPTLSEYCLPFVKVGGLFVAYKGKDGEAELAAAEKAVETLGGAFERIIRYTLPGSDAERTLILIRKVRPTPERYPRKAGKPEKSPIK